MKTSEYMRQASNLPEWPGAEVVYSRLYKLLAEMGAANWRTEVARAQKARRKPKPPQPTDDMRDIIDALDKGDEETLKGLMHKFQAYRV